MDWLIWFTGAQMGETAIQAYFQGVGSNGKVVNFAVAYAYGATNTAKKSAITAAAIAAYTLIYGEAPPASARAEIIGVVSI